MEISSVSDCISLYRLEKAKYGGHELWFRGVSDESYRLKPTVFRQEMEEDLIEHFLMSSKPETFGGQTLLERLTYLQHYSAPTRLLDWSRNILVSLYFAACADPKKDGRLYVLDPFALNSRSALGGELTAAGLKYRLDSVELTVRICLAFSGDPNILLQNLSRTYFDERTLAEIANSLEKYSGSIAIVAPQRNPRIIAQNGVFTVQGGKKSRQSGIWMEGRDINPRFIDEEPNKEVLLSCHSIQAKKKPDLLEELSFFGITESTLFPEFERFAIESRHRGGSVGVEF